MEAGADRISPKRRYGYGYPLPSDYFLTILIIINTGAYNVQEL